MSLEMMMGHLVQAHRTSQDLKDLSGRVYGIQVGIVTDRNDPLRLAQIKATVGTQGGKSETDWLMRAIFMPLASVPVPQVGDTVLIGYQDGDPHKGFYLAVLQNNLNPSSDPDSFVMSVGDGVLTIDATGMKYTIGGSTLEVRKDFVRTTVQNPLLPILKTVTTQNDHAVAWDGVYSFTINGQSVTRGGSQSSTDPDVWNNPVPVYVPPVLPPSPQIH